MSKPTERETSIRGRATMAKLIETAKKELDRVGPAKFDIDTVLRKSKVSKGSLYHHFGSKNGLLVVVETSQFIEYLKDQNIYFRELVGNCKSSDKFLTLMTRVFETSGRQENRDLRRRRLRAIVLSQHDKVLGALIKNEQTESSIFLAKTFQIAIDRGWLKADVNAHALAYWFQGLFMGHIMLDITDIDNLDDAWNEIAITSLKSLFTA